MYGPSLASRAFTTVLTLLVTIMLARWAWQLLQPLLPILAGLLLIVAGVAAYRRWERRW